MNTNFTLDPNGSILTTAHLTGTSTTTTPSWNTGFYQTEPYIVQDTSPDYMVHRDSMQLVKDEIYNMDSINPNELNKLIGSTNSEDFELAMNMLESQGSIYSHRILRTIRNSYPSVDSLRLILREWYQKNYLNITNKYI